MDNRGPNAAATYRKHSVKHMQEKKLNPQITATVILAVVIFAVNIRNIVILNGPQMFNDELGYLGNAAVLAGKDWNSIMQHSLWYSYGWSLMITPLFWMFSNMRIIYRCINLLNALIVVTVFLMQRHILQKLFKNANPNFVLAVSACVCFYPSILINSSMAWCETWLLFVFTAITIFLYYLIQNPRPYKAAVFGGLLYYFYVCHNRMAAVIIAGVLVFILLYLTRSVNKKAAVFFLVAFILSSLAFGLIKEYIVSQNWQSSVPSGNDFSSEVSRFPNLLNVEGITNFIGVVCGQFLYICVSSFGMVPLGLWSCMCRIVQAIQRRELKKAILEAWLILSFLGVLAVSSISMGATVDMSTHRLDHIFYGRYLEPVSMLLFAYGILSLPVWKQKARYYEIYCVVYSCAVSVFAILAFIVTCRLEDPIFYQPNASGIAVYVELLNGSEYFVFAAALFGVIGMNIFALLPSSGRYWYIAPLGLAVACTVSMLPTDRSIITTQEMYREEAALVNTIAAYDTAGLPVYAVHSGYTKSYYQCMLVDVPLQYSPDDTLGTIPEDKFYAIVPVEDYYVQGFEEYNEIIAANKNNVFLLVNRHEAVEKTRLSIPLDMLELNDISHLEFDHIHVETAGRTLAFYGPYMKLVPGNYELYVDLLVQSAEDLDDYGTLQIYSASPKKILGEMLLTKEMLGGESGQVTVPFFLDRDVSDVEVYLRTRSGVIYDVYGLGLTRNYMFDYRLNEDELNFIFRGFSNAESLGRWMTKSFALVDCYLPADDYLLTVDLGHVVPLRKLGMKEYSVKVYVNGKYLEDITIHTNTASSRYQFNVPKEYLKNGTNSVVFVCKQLWSPADYGSQDFRSLGINIKRIQFTPYTFEYALNADDSVFAISGFSYAEPEGRWMIESNAAIDCYLPADNYQLTVDLSYPVPLEQLGIEEYSAGVYVNDFYLGDITVSTNSGSNMFQLDVPKEYLKDGSNSVAIVCEQLWSPADFGSQDLRSLGICIRSILFTPVK